MEMLHSMIAEESTPLKAIQQHLDGLLPEQRWEALMHLTRGQMRELWNRAENAVPTTLDDFVPPSFPAHTPVRHRGRNTLPLPGPLRYFEKRFCRPSDGTPRLFGYNEGLTRPFIGPGYFVVHDTKGNAAWEQRGNIVIDYHMTPDGKVSVGWPQVVSNNVGLQMLVFKNTRDFMRKVSGHVTIGAAYKNDKPLDHYFVLCREG